jgi:Plasmid pRiA4b ORF-3-like protein
MRFAWMERTPVRRKTAAASGGYYELLEAVNNPNHEEHQEMLDWLGGQFDPGRFDLQKINAKLRGLGNLARGLCGR